MVLQKTGCKKCTDSTELPGVFMGIIGKIKLTEMRSRLRLIQKIQPLNRMRMRTDFHWSTVVISALVFNTFLLAYSYLNIGVPEKAKAGITTMSAANGNWTSAATWSAGRLPQDGDT